MRREKALRGPVGGRSLAVAGFVKQGIDYVSVPMLRALDLEHGRRCEVPEKGQIVVSAEDLFMNAVETSYDLISESSFQILCRAKFGSQHSFTVSCELKEPGYSRTLSAHCCHRKPTVRAEIDTQLQETSCAQMTLSTLYSHRFVSKPAQKFDDPPYSFHILRVLGIVLLIPLRDFRIQPLIHLVRSISQWRQSSKQESFLETLRVKAQICRAAESTKTLPDDTPLLLFLGIVCRERLADSFRIFDDAVGTEALHILCLHLFVTAKLERGLRNGSRETSTALVQGKNLVAFVEEEAGPSAVLRRRAFETGSTLEVD